MTTATFQLGFRILLLSFAVLLSACQKNEFGQKDALTHPVPDVPVDGSVDGSVSGGGDSTTGGTVTGGGDTSGSTTGGGDTTGSTTGGGSGATWADETFQQAAETTKKLDIVWVIDNSNSMADEQSALGSNFDLFIQDFITRQVDFQMAITTTDTTGDNGGQAVAGSQAKLTSAMAQANQTQFLSDFNSLVRVGINGSGNEKGLEASKMFLDRFQSSWLRPDAYLVVVYVSDEEDQSPLAKEDYLARLRGAKDNDGYVKAYSIVGITGCPANTNGYTCGYQRYQFQADETGGSTSDIHGNFAQILESMSGSVINLLDSFPLAHSPLVGTTTVKVNGTLTTEWTLDNRQLKFTAGNIPPVGAQIDVRYQY